MAGMTEHGLKHDSNQDAFFIDPQNKIACVCDGIGGHNGGAEASEMVVDVFKTYDILDHSCFEEMKMCQKNAAMFPDENNFVQLAHIANDKVHKRSTVEKSLKGMGSTLVSLYIREGKDICFINVGDSRAYYINDQLIRQITNDHSLIEELRSKKYVRKADAFSLKIENVITRAIGALRDVEVDFYKECLREGFYLLCSDGLTSGLSEGQIHNCLLSERMNCQNAVRKLIDEAKEAGAVDDVTAVIFKIDKSKELVKA